MPTVPCLTPLLRSPHKALFFTNGLKAISEKLCLDMALFWHKLKRTNWKNHLVYDTMLTLNLTFWSATFTGREVLFEGVGRGRARKTRRTLQVRKSEHTGSKSTSGGRQKQRGIQGAKGLFFDLPSTSIFCEEKSPPLLTFHAPGAPVAGRGGGDPKNNKIISYTQTFSRRKAKKK